MNRGINGKNNVLEIFNLYLKWAFLLQNINDTGLSTPRRSSQRRVAGGTTYQVLFTGFSDAKQESIVKQLGMKINNRLLLLEE
jgi:hypothetical protein